MPSSWCLRTAHASLLRTIQTQALFLHPPHSILQSMSFQGFLRASHDHRGYPLDADGSEWKRSSGCPRRGVSERRMRLFFVLYKPKLFSFIHRTQFCNQCHFEVYCAQVMTIGDIRLTPTTRSGRDRRGVSKRRIRLFLVLYKPKLFSFIHSTLFCKKRHFEVYCTRHGTIEFTI